MSEWQKKVISSFNVSNGPINGKNGPINGKNGPINGINGPINEKLTNIQKEIEELLDIGHATLLRHKKVLIDKQYIVRIGSNKNGYWQV